MRQIVIQVVLLIYAINCAAQTHVFSILNSLALQRDSELVVLKRGDIKKYAGLAAKGFNYEIKSGSKKIVYQIVDDNQDGEWDKLVFLSSFKPTERKLFTITTVKQDAFQEDVWHTLAHVRMKHKNEDGTFGESVISATMPYQNPPTDFSKQKLPPYLAEGPGWENDKTAFRLYFDTRNTIDIYGKRIAGMVMDTVGVNPLNSYHNLSPWGMDILHVVKSLGGGSIAIATKDENGKDTLIRVGGKNIIKETYRQIADGPLYAAFEMDYDWTINNKPVSIKQQFRIWGGQYFYESKVTITGVPQGSKLVSGIADFYENSVDSFHTSTTAALLSYGRQSENKDELSMAVLLPQQSFAFFKEAPKSNSDVMETHLAAQDITDNKPLIYRFYSCWNMTNENFISRDYFRQFMETEAGKFGQPLTV